MSKKQADAPLSVKVTDGRLVISIGISTLAFAAQECNYCYSYDQTVNDFVHHMKVTDPLLFAKELVTELQEEDEEGTTSVHLMIDKAVEQAVENGARGFNWDGQDF